MTFLERIESLSDRFLSDRSYELIVAPAMADLQHDATSERRLPLAQGQLSVLVAFAGAVYEDLTANSSLLRMAGLTLIPALYYTFLIYLCQPQMAQYVAATFGRLAMPGAIALVSVAPVLACCWPERAQRRSLRPCSGQAADA